MCHYRRILTWIVPLRLLLKGSWPSPVLLERYPAIDSLYGRFVRAITQGDVVAFDEALQALESRLVQLNVWIIVLRMREIALRGVFRKVYVYRPSAPLPPFSITEPKISLKVESPRIRNARVDPSAPCRFEACWARNGY
jgi:hypothetical protein